MRFTSDWLVSGCVWNQPRSALLRLSRYMRLAILPLLFALRHPEIALKSNTNVPKSPWQGASNMPQTHAFVFESAPSPCALTIKGKPSISTRPAMRCTRPIVGYEARIRLNGVWVTSWHYLRPESAELLHVSAGGAATPSPNHGPLSYATPSLSSAPYT